MFHSRARQLLLTYNPSNPTAEFSYCVLRSTMRKGPMDNPASALPRLNTTAFDPLWPSARCLFCESDPPVWLRGGGILFCPHRQKYVDKCHLADPVAISTTCIKAVYLGGSQIRFSVSLVSSPPTRLQRGEGDIVSNLADRRHTRSARKLKLVTPESLRLSGLTLIFPKPAARQRDILHLEAPSIMASIYTPKHSLLFLFFDI